MRLQNFTAYVEPETFARLNAISDETRIPVAKLVRKAIEDFLQRTKVVQQPGLLFGVLQHTAPDEETR